MIEYSWAQNKLKLERATKLAPPDDEAEIQRIYISLGGKVVGPIIQPKAVEAPVETNDENNKTATEAVKKPKAK